MKLILYFLLLGLVACGQENSNPKKHIVVPEARRLNDSAFTLIRSTKNYQKAILLLNKAIEIDSNYYTAYSNKIAFQLELKEYDSVMKTAMQLIRIKPDDLETYFGVGFLFVLTSDTISCQKYFNKALPYFDKELDTMNTANKYYNNLLGDKALDLILVGQEIKGNVILKQLYDNKQSSEIFREGISLYMNKSRQEILKFMKEGAGGTY